MAQLQVEIALSVVNKVRGVAGQQLRAFESESGCSLSLVRKGGSAVVEISGHDLGQCEAAARSIVNFVAALQNGAQVQRPPTLQSAPSVGNPVPVVQPVLARAPQQQMPAYAATQLPQPRMQAYASPAAPVQPVANYATPAANFATPVANYPAPIVNHAAPSAPAQPTVNPYAPATLVAPPQTAAYSAPAAAPLQVASSPAAPPQVRPQPAVAVSLVEIPLAVAEQVQAKAQEFSDQSQCTFEVALERNRGLVRIGHPDLGCRVNARRMLTEFIAVLMPPVEVTYEKPKPPPVKVEPRTESRPKRDFNFNNIARTDELQGWNEPVETDRDRMSKEPRNVVKNFYVEHPEITAMSEQAVATFRKESMDINVKYLGTKPLSTGIPKPVTTFRHAFENYPEILSQLEKKFQTPSPIQSQSWPILMSGNDMVGIAQTGTGKTLAFLLPAFIHTRGQPVVSKRYEGPTCLVLSPTRELAIQIYDESVKYAYRNINCACCYGGAVRSTQMDQLRKNPEIIIATPGRLNDLVENMIVSLKNVSYLVLDEADRMLDMGFEPQIRQILHYVSSNRQTVMTSATWPPNVRRLSSQYLKDPVQVIIGSLDLSAALTVTQRVRMVRGDEKFPIVLNLMKSLKPNDRAIVFCGRKMTTDVVARKLTQNGIRAESIHGDRDQREREAALRHLRNGKSKVLVATDVASRGLDVQGITVVVNFDFPSNIEEYVHRVGRTGRAGSTGSSYTLMTSGDGRFAKELTKILEKAKQQVPDWLRKLSMSSLYPDFD